MNGGNDNSTGGSETPNYDLGSESSVNNNYNTPTISSFSQEGGTTNLAESPIVMKKSKDEVGVRGGDSLFSKAIDFTKGFFVTKKE
jgi:hypothetical protein